MRRIPKLGWVLAAAATLFAQTASAQNLPPGNGCGNPAADAADCYAVAQALRSAVPQVGIAAAGGNPLLGTASVGGVRLGFLPRVTAGLRLTAARVRLPDVDDANFDVAGSQSSEILPSLDVDAAVSAFAGFTRGAAAGIGSLDLLLSTGVLPGAGGLKGSSLAYGAGVRVGILRETFGTPAVNVSAMYRRVDGVQIGRACPVSPLPCPDRGAGQLDFGVEDVSARATVGKRVARVGLVGGLGYDRFTGRDARFTYSNGVFGTEQAQKVREGRWSAFANLSYPLMVGAVTLEGGWMSGGGRVTGYPDGAAFDPGAGTLFGSLGLRLSL